MKTLSMVSMRKKEAVLLVTALFLAGGCATESGGLSERESGALVGGGLGAGTGAIIGAATGHAGVGTAIGAGVGALTGAAVGEANRQQKETTKREIREETMVAQSQQTQPAVTTYQARSVEELHTKYNPATGQTYPDRYQFDPVTGARLELIRSV